MTTLNPIYDVNDEVYFVIYSKVEIFKAVVTRVHIHLPEPSIKYDITFTSSSLSDNYLDMVPESNLKSFDDAKADLLAWLAAKTEEITNLTEIV